MSRLQPLEVDDVEQQASKSGLVERLLRRLSGSATYSQLDTSDVHTARLSEDRWSPEEDASLWSKLTYSYASGLIKLGYSQPLHQHHLWDMARKHEAAPLTDRFHAALDGTHDAVTAPHGKVLHALWKVHWRRLATAAGFRMLQNLCAWTGPFLLQSLLGHLQAGAAIWWGLLISVAMFTINSSQSLVMNYYFFLGLHTALHVKVDLLDMLYQKSLRLGVDVRNARGVGTVVNLQSNDASKVWMMPVHIHTLWNSPFQIVVLMALLSRMLTWQSAMTGLGVTLSVIPLSIFVGRWQTRIRLRVVQRTDARVKLTGEVLSGIKAIKLYAWEQSFKERILSLRHLELTQIRHVAYLEVIQSLVFGSTPILIALSAFAVYTAQGYPLTPAVAFPALALFNLLRFPITMLPWYLMEFINGWVALGRMQRFMQEDEVKHHKRMDSARDGESAVEARRASFAWEQQMPPALHDISLKAIKGQLVMVVGVVGSGKSSLIAALLGELHGRGGTVEVHGSTSYTAQDPWIQNCSLQDNILMGLPLDSALYDSVLRACALLPDLALLPAGDQTEIGEKGVNLSGGQRHRVALARACYTQSDIALLDDPLSAVDAHVGAHIFQTCICGLLAGRTRILATHQMQYLPAADWVVVMEAGRISHQGRYEDLLAQGVELHQASMPSSSSLSNTSSDIAPDTPQRSPTHPPSPTHLGPQAAPNAHISATQQHAQPPPIDSARHQLAAESSQGETDGPKMNPDQTQKAEGSIQPALTSLDSLNKPQVLPLLANSAGALLSDRLADPALLSSQDMMLQSHQHEQSEAETIGLSQGAVQTGFRAAGKVSMAEGMSEPVTEAIEALGPVRKNPNDDEAHESTDAKGRLMKVEGRNVGKVDTETYRIYARAWGAFYILPILMLLLAVTERSFYGLQNWWLSVWSNANASTVGIHPSEHPQLASYYLKVYVAFSLALMAANVFRNTIAVWGSYIASKKMHARLLGHVLILPMAFFDSQPLGRLLNRFTKDTEAVDVELLKLVLEVVDCLASALGALAVVLFVTPAILVVAVPLAFGYLRVQNLYIATNRELKRLDSIALSPIFSKFSETLSGLITLRAFSKQQHFAEQNKGLIDQSNRAWWPMQIMNRWLAIRIDFISNIVVFGTAILVSVVLPVNAGLAGLAITAAINLTDNLSWFVRMATDLEVNMNAVERMVEYTSQPTEGSSQKSAWPPPRDWPHAGGIVIDNLQVRYREDLDLVLKGLSLSIKPREKIGIVGRTGCGKSTLMSTLFRIVEPTGGRVVIDGHDLAQVPLHQLRTKLALVSQDPVVFSGTVRDNLDPFGACEGDPAIWSALRQTGMANTVSNLQGGLDAVLGEAGSNLSSGQRQLLCMARALLRKAKVLVLDEATSNVDTASDALIQETVRAAFADCTVLTIAHRLHSILDSDRILVLEDGRVKEFDTPESLLQDPNGTYYAMMSRVMTNTKGSSLQ
ncbi:TPA: hypothetical protein ACH3X2_010602 [Trebouxia sp. C0005]